MPNTKQAKSGLCQPQTGAGRPASAGAWNDERASAIRERGRETALAWSGPKAGSFSRKIGALRRHFLAFLTLGL